MKTVHLFEEGYYFISNKAVAKCFLFKDAKDYQRFKTKIDHHLAPICSVLAYGFTHDEFQLLVRLKDRKTIESHFLSKFGTNSDPVFIPETAYIFAQAMANLQSGYAKYFNYKYERDGGLMKGRYHRVLIENESELDQMIDNIHQLNTYYQRNGIWTFRRKEEGFVFGMRVDASVRCSREYYNDHSLRNDLLCLCRKGQIYVRGHFDKLPPKRIEFKNSHEKFRNLVSFLLMKSF